MIRNLLSCYLSYMTCVAVYLFVWNLIATYNENWETRDILSYHLSQMIIGNVPVVFVWLVFLIPLRGTK